MKRFVVYLIIFISLLPAKGICETKEIIAEGEYVMGEGETMEVAGEKARKNAIRVAAEEAGTFVRSFTKVQDFVLQEDVVEVVANHSMEIAVLDEQTELVGKKSIRFRTRIRATISSAEVEANIKKARDDRTVVEAYNRLKTDYEKQNKEVEQLKKQLANAVGGDRQKIAQHISEEEKKYKANLWVEKAQHFSLANDEVLNAYRKAVELNPELALAYVGIANALRFQNIGRTDELKELENKIGGLREALANLNKAVSIDENYANAYAMRVYVLEEISATEHEIHVLKDTLHDFADKEKKYNEQIFKDINRSIALNASDTADMYRKRSILHVREAFQAAVTRSNPKIIEENFDKALTDANQAIALCNVEDLWCLIKSYQTKTGIYNDLKGYYIKTNNPAKANEVEVLANHWYQKSEELAIEKSQRDNKESERIRKLYEASEIGKLVHYINDSWKEGVLGPLSVLEESSEDEREKIVRQKIALVEKRISTGTASAEDHLILAMFNFEDSVDTRKNNYDKGVALYEKRNPEGREALLLMHFYIAKSIFHFDQQHYDNALSELNKAKAVIDRHFYQATKLLNLEDFWQIAKADFSAPNRLNKEGAEAFYWIQFAAQVPSFRAKIYEKLDLSAKAIEEYRYLCDTLKYNEACADVDRLK